MYKVITAFRDDKDGNKVYKPGDEYTGPTDEERLHKLTTTDNRIKKVLIERDPSKEPLPIKESEEGDDLSNQTENDDVTPEEGSDDVSDQTENEDALDNNSGEKEPKKTKNTPKKPKQKSKD